MGAGPNSGPRGRCSGCRDGNFVPGVVMCKGNRSTFGQCPSKSTPFWQSEQRTNSRRASSRARVATAPGGGINEEWRGEKEPAATRCPVCGSGFCRSLEVAYRVPNPQSVSSAGRRILGHRRRFIVNVRRMAIPRAHDDGEGRSLGDEPRRKSREAGGKGGRVAEREGVGDIVCRRGGRG